MAEKMICSKCKEVKGLCGFRFRVRNGRKQKRSQCKNCESKAQIVRNKKKMIDPQYKEKSIQRVLEWDVKNKDRRLKAESERRKRKYQEDSEYRAKVRERTAYRRTYATPSWVDRERIKEIYSDCPEGFHVDHIIPLKGKNVCGLHVPWNLQYLPAGENLEKNNNYNSDDISSVKL